MQLTKEWLVVCQYYELRRVEESESDSSFLYKNITSEQVVFEVDTIQEAANRCQQLGLANIAPNVMYSFRKNINATNHNYLHN